jgi:WD40 repeat protein
MAETLTNTPQQSSLDHVYERYQNRLKQEVLGTTNQSEVVKGIMSGKISEEQIDRLKQETITLEDFRSYYYPRELSPEVEVKRRYRKNILISEENGHHIHFFQVLPNGDIVSAESDHKIYLWQKEGEENYKKVFIGGHNANITVIQGLPNGDIVSGSNDGDICLWKKKGDEGHEKILIGNDKWITTLHALPNGDVVSGAYKGNICLWQKENDGKYNKTLIETCGGSIETLHVLPNGSIFFTEFCNKVFVWRREKDGSYQHRTLIADTYNRVVQNLSNGNLIFEGLNDDIYLWELNEKREYHKEKIGQHKQFRISTLQALINGDMVFSNRNGDIYVWKEKKSGSYKQKLIKKGDGIEVQGFQVLSNSDIVFTSSNQLRILK